MTNTINTPLKKFAVIGDPIDHSLSPYIQHQFAKALGHQIDYQKIHCQTQAFEQTVKDFFASGGSGLNVTAPFKQAAAALVSASTKEASVNTLWLAKQAQSADVEKLQIKGCSTDGIGFIKALNNQGVALSNQRLLIIGAGGVTQALMPALISASCQRIHIANRTATKYQHWLSDVVTGSSLTDITNRSFDLVINALSIKDPKQYPSLPVSLSASAIGYDINYGENALAFKQAFIALGGNPNNFIDGWGMLVEQAAESYQIWHGVRPNTQPLIASGPPL